MDEPRHIHTQREKEREREREKGAWWYHGCFILTLRRPEKEVEVYFSGAHQHRTRPLCRVASHLRARTYLPTSSSATLPPRLPLPLLLLLVERFMGNQRGREREKGARNQTRSTGWQERRREEEDTVRELSLRVRGRGCALRDLHMRILYLIYCVDHPPLYLFACGSYETRQQRWKRERERMCFLVY